MTEGDSKSILNFESYDTPKVAKLVQTLGDIANLHDQYETSVAYLGNNAIMADLKTRRQLGIQISDMPTKQLTPQ